MSTTYSEATAPLAARAQASAEFAIDRLERQLLAVVAFAAAALMAAADVAVDPSKLTLSLGDTDDATRLTEVRQLLAGQAWYDMTLARFGGAEPLISHWSRIIDAPLAALIWLISAVAPPEQAELAARIIWPTLLAGLMAYLIALTCDRLASRRTALLALALAVPCPGHFQFTPGRIDHHNGMIIGAVGGTLVLLAALDRPKLGWWAGALLGLGCAIGYEGLLPTIAALGIVTLATLTGGGSLAGPARAAAAFAATMLLLFVGFGPFWPDGHVACDALSSNLIALAACAAAGIGLAHMSRCLGQPVWTQLAYTAAFGVLGLALYAVTAPACLGGPFAEVAPRLGPVWLSQVSETRSLIAVGRASLSDMLQLASYPVIALGYGAVVVRARMIPHGASYMAIFVATLLMGLVQIKLLPYAIFLAVPLIALGLSRPVTAPTEPKHVPSLPETRAGTLRGRWASWPNLAAWALTAVAVAITAVGATALVTTRDGSAAATPAPVAVTYADCTNATNIRPLASLGPARVANDIDLGPYLVAWTALDAVAAPYHRLGHAILAVHDLLHAPASEAAARMKALGARYVMVCAGLSDTAADRPVPNDALRTELLAGRAPPALEPVAIGLGNIKVWRLKPE